MSLFDDFWDNHPGLQDPEIHAPCVTDGKPNFENQCAIRLGVSLVSSGIDFHGYQGVFCWHGHGREHPLRVEELKIWLNTRADFISQKADISEAHSGSQKTWQDYQHRKGIVACLNFWGENNQGDHIDLWNGEEMAYGSNEYFERSQQIWFWDIP